MCVLARRKFVYGGIEMVFGHLSYFEDLKSSALSGIIPFLYVHLPTCLAFILGLLMLRTVQVQANMTNMMQLMCVDKGLRQKHQ